MATPRAVTLATRSGLWWSLLALWFALQFILSSIPTLPPGPGIPFQDKIQHTVYYALGGCCIFLALRFRHPPTGAAKSFLAALLFCLAIGGFDEWHQSFTPGRKGNDLWDWLADALGGVLGPLIGMWAHRKLRALSNPMQAC